MLWFQLPSNYSSVDPDEPEDDCAFTTTDASVARKVLVWNAGTHHLLCIKI